MAGASAFIPEMAMGVGLMLILVIDMFSSDKHSLTAGVIGFISVAVAFALTANQFGNDPVKLFHGLVVVDDFALFFNLAILIVTGLVIVASYEYIKKSYPAGFNNFTEYVVLVLFSALGMMVMASSDSLVTVFIGLELTSLPAYALVAFLKEREASIEGGMKYFLLGALSSAVLLYGISLVYGATGTFKLDQIHSVLQSGSVGPIFGLGVMFVLFGFAFKITAVPFQVWAPDAYTGAPTPITAFIASASKIAGFVVLFRVFMVAFSPSMDWILAVQILAVVTMTFGNFAAAVQSSVKRMLAYSSIGQAGYVLIALAVFSNSATGDSVFALGAGMSHLFVYAIMNTGAFLTVALIDDYWEFGYTFEDYSGIAKQVPFLGVAMAVFMFSLAGLPTGAGFVSKLVLFGSAVNSGFWWLAAIGAVNSALSLFYYTKVLKYMWVEEPSETQPVIDRKPVGIYVAIFAAAIATFVLMFAFSPILETATQAADGLLA
ncbi:MAG: NADH-quinone oxidoreductase subunit N [Halobacteria archaeon]